MQNQPLSKDRISYLNRLHGIKKIHVRSIKLFILSLATLVNDTYMGDEYYEDDDDITNHFLWCLSKITKKDIIDINTDSFLFIKDIFMFIFYKNDDVDKRYEEIISHFDLFIDGKNTNLYHYEIFLKYYNYLIEFIDL